MGEPHIFKLVGLVLSLPVTRNHIRFLRPETVKLAVKPARITFLCFIAYGAAMKSSSVFAIRCQ